ncbi:MAG: AAA family ATPase, partial [Acetobacter papayae]
MTVRFARLRIAGFKSFADPVTVEILPGLTGIVGPNGCGKSNVVEALRWVMGESSARSLRGGEMDDLIFAGTATRPARTLAEVTITLEGTKGFGPQNFAELDELQISRRAERGAGSDYRINGRSIRARDVQTLFADLASGARSSAMVSQGRVAMLVGARPEERRGILEEAAGITGLHARRHEAELKLRATESNLTRAEDRRKQLSERLGELADQSREAEQYRTLSAALREAETELLALLHARARLAVQRAADTVAQARLALSSREEAAETSVMAEFERRRRLPALREQADAARTALERCRVLAEGTAREEERALTLAREANERLTQHEADLQAATNRLTDARSALERTQAEKAEIDAASATLPTRQEEAATRQETLRLELESTERDLAALTETLNIARAQYTHAQEELENARARHSLTTQALSAIEAEVAELEAALPSNETLLAIAATAESTALAAQQARTTADESERQRAQRAMELSVARSQAEAARQAQAEQKENITQARQRLDSLAKALQQAETRRAEAMAALVSPETLDHLRLTEEEAAKATQQAIEALETAEQARLQADTQLNESSRAAQEAEARHRNATEALRAAETALSRARQEEQVLSQELEKARAEAMPDSVLEEARQARMAQENSLQQISQSLEQAEQALPARRETLSAATARRTTLQTELTRLHAQAEGLDHALDEEEPQAGSPVSAQLSVEEQYEPALAAALADGLDASTTETAVRGWRLLAAAAPPALPTGTTPLKALVSAPPELERILTFTGLVPDNTDAIALLPSLAPGQCLVSRAGDLWRWDGFYARATATGGAARRLAQRRILRETRARIDALQADEPALEQAVEQATQAVQETERAIASLRGERATVERALQHARTHESETGRRHASSRARLDTIQPQQERVAAARLEAESAHARAQETQAALPPVHAPREALQAAQNKHATAQASEQAARTQLRQLQARLQTARDERAGSEQKHAAAQARLDTLTPECARLRDAHASEQAAFDVLAQRLATIEADQQAALALETATQALNEAEQTVKQTLEQARLAQQAADAAANENQRSREHAADLRGRLAGLTPRMAELRQSQVETTEQVVRAESALQAAAIPAETEQTLEQLRARRQECQTKLDATREERAALLAESTALTNRRAAAEAALEDWGARAETASREEESIRQRMQDVRSEHERLSTLPDAARQQKQQTQQNLTEAEEAH